MSTGKTNAKWIRVWVEDSGTTLRDISTDVTDVNMPITVASTDVTGYSDGVINFTVGQPDQPVTMSGHLNNTADTGSHIVLRGIVGQATPLISLRIQVGILAAPSGTDPEYEGEYLCTEYSLAGDLKWNATFLPGSSTAPDWDTFTAP
jgi:hypothetical protein